METTGIFGGPHNLTINLLSNVKNIKDKKDRLGLMAHGEEQQFFC